MALETATYIDGLVATNPAASDAISTADDHIRLLKSTIKATFPNINGPITRTDEEINSSASLASPAFTGTPTAPTAASGTNTTQIATTAFVQAALQAFYPVGSIYTNATNSTNPATLLGFGTWTAFGAGRVMVGFNGSDPLFDSAEETGGSKDAIAVSHTHTYSGTTSTTGSHTHTGKAYAAAVGSYSEITQSGLGTTVLHEDSGHTNNFGTTFDLQGPIVTDPAGDHSHTFSGTTASAGSSGTNANLQPYITVYMWKRTA